MIIPFELRTKASVTSPFGIRSHPITGEQSFHSGVDIVIHDRIVRAVEDGVIRSVNMDPNKDTAGIYVTITHKNGLISKYFHLHHTTMKVGVKVKTGDVIGIMGTTGRSTGPHLHFQVNDASGKAIEPTALIGIKNKVGPVEFEHWAEKDFIGLNQAGCGFTRREYTDNWADLLAVTNRTRKVGNV